jgi:hypothetical protein
MEISWNERVRNEVLHRVKEERNILHAINRRRTNWICDILRRNCLTAVLKERQKEVMGRRGRRRKQLLDDHKEKRRYWKLKEQAQYRALWRTSFGRGYGPVIRETTQ